MIVLLNIVFLAGGIFLLAAGLDLAVGKRSAPKIRIILSFAIFPLLLLAAAFLASSSSPPASRFLASPANAAAVGAAYVPIACGLFLLRRRRTASSPELREVARRPAARIWWLPLLICLLAVAVQALFPAGAGTRHLFAFLLGAAALASLPLLDTGGEARAFILACLPFLAFGAAWTISPEMATGDSTWLQFPTFQFIARSFAAGHYLPPWLPQSGGIRIGLLSINVPFALPHKALTYLLYSLFPIHLTIIYKLQYLIGVLTFSLGWWLVLRTMTGSRTAAFFGVLMLTLGGTGITFHQEQVVATAYLLPWFILALLNTRRTPLWIIPAAVIAGLGLTLHYPHIQAVSLSLAALAMVAAGLFNPVKVIRSGKKFILPALFLAFVATGPSLYIWHYSPRLSSVLRGQDIGDKSSDLKEYLRLQTGASSAAPAYFRQYYAPTWTKAGRESPPIDVSDRCAFFVGRAGLVLAGAGLLLGFPLSGLVGLLAVIFSLLSAGINSPVNLPNLFFNLGIPFFDIFRQWVHFFPMVNYSLSLLAAIGTARLLKTGGRTFHRAAVIAVAGAVFLQVYDTVLYGRRYLSLFPTRELAYDLREHFFERGDFSATSLFQYRDRARLNRFCGEKAIPERAFLAAGVLNLDPEENFQPETVCRLLEGNLPGLAVIQIPEEFNFLALTDRSGEAEGLEFSAGFAGAGGLFSAGHPGLAVIPLNRELKPRAFLDGREAPVWTVNAALTGVPVPEGNHRLELKIGHDWYLLFFLLQWLLYLGLAILFLKTKWFPAAGAD